MECSFFEKSAGFRQKSIVLIAVKDAVKDAVNSYKSNIC